MKSVSKVLIIFLLLAACCNATIYSTIHGNVKYADGHPVYGRVTISWPSFNGIDGFVPKGTSTVTVTASNYVVTLRPNADSGVYYTSKFVLTSEGGASWTEQWFVQSTSTDSDSIKQPPPGSSGTGSGGVGPVGPAGPKGDKGDKGDPAITGTLVTNEAGTVTTGGWSLAHTPLSTPVCYLNGLRLQSGTGKDFTMTGSTVVAPYWSVVMAGDSETVLTCDYTY